MHREKLVVEVGADQPGFRPRQLQAHHHGAKAAEAEKDEGGDDIAAADDLVVDGREPAIRLEPVPQVRASRACSSDLAQVGIAQVRTAGCARTVVIAGPPDSRREDRSRPAAIDTIGMLTPGLMPCGSTIQAAMLPRLIGSVALAIDWRLPKCVRSGPTREPADVPRMVWHMTHALLAKRSAPLWRSASAGCRGRSALSLAPGLEFGAWQCDHQQAHMRVLPSAELRALAPIHTRTTGDEVYFVILARDEVQLAH